MQPTANSRPGDRAIGLALLASAAGLVLAAAFLAPDTSPAERALQEQRARADQRRARGIVERSLSRADLLRPDAELLTGSGPALLADLD